MEAQTHAPLLRIDQVEEMEGDREVLQRKLESKYIEDKGVVRDQLRRLERQLETQRPRPYASEEIDAAVKREVLLRSKWTEGMLSQEEMRKCPPGAVDRHRAWERKHKRAIAEWQNIQRRLNAGGEDREAASIERFRPTTSTMNMDGAQIPGKNFHLPPPDAALGVTFTEAEMAALRTLNPALAEKLALYTNAERAEVKTVLSGAWTAERRAAASEAGKRGMEKKRAMSDDQKQKIRDGLARRRERKERDRARAAARAEAKAATA